MGFSVAALDLLEFAVAPGLDVVASAGGWAALTGWRGTTLALLRPAAAAGEVDPGAGGWRARQAPRVTRSDGDTLTVRSSIDGSTHRFSASELLGIAEGLGATPVDHLVPGGALHWWTDPEDDLPPSGWVVGAVPAEAGRDGRYLAAGEWRSISAVTDAAAAGPLVASCSCRACSTAAVGYIAHLWRQREITAAHLLGWHNLHQARLLVEA